MKNKNLMWILLCLITVSCGEDRRKEYAAQTDITRWIQQTMKENYYWYQDMPSSGLNYFNKPDVFVSALLSSNDASYTYIEDPTSTADLSSYGMLYNTSIRYNDSAYAVRVLYVDSDSPAHDAGIQRGDWLIKWNNQYIIKTRIDSLAQGNAISLTKGEYEMYLDENENTAYRFADSDTVNLSASRITSDNPIHFSEVYHTGSHTVGYLVYNRFNAGTDADSELYNNELRSLSNSFYAEGVTDFILDLRYNTGGTIEEAQLLGSILAPADAMNKTMYTLVYNDLQSDKDESYTFNTNIIGSGTNLNLSTLYVIIDSRTASISDVLINSLAAHMNVVTIGTTSAGFYGVTHEYMNENYPYILHLVDCVAFNANNSAPSTGHTPTHSVSESLSNAAVDIYPLGNSNEVLLSNALYLIENGALPTSR